MQGDKTLTLPGAGHGSNPKVGAEGEVSSTHPSPTPSREIRESDKATLAPGEGRTSGSPDSE